MGEGGSNESGKPGDSDANLPGVPPAPVANGRLRAAEIVALKLGELLEDLLEELRALPRWWPAPSKRREIERALEVGLTLFHAWQDAYDPEPA